MKREVEQLEVAWKGGDWPTWLELLRRLAPEEAARLPDYIVKAIEVISNSPGPPEPTHIEECSPAELVRYAIAERDDVIFEVAYIDGFTDEWRVEKATAGMLHDLLAELEKDAELCRLVSNYWATLAVPGSGGEQGGGALWYELTSAFDPILVGLFGQGDGRGLLGIKLKTIAIYVFKMKHLAR